MDTLLFFLLYFAVILAISVYLKATRVERKRRQFEKRIAALHANEQHHREDLVRKSQAAMMRELSVMTKKELNRFQKEIPPRIYQEATLRIDKLTKEIDFDGLYTLHELLIKTDDEKVWQDLRGTLK